MTSFFLDSKTSVRYYTGHPFSYGGINYTKAGANPKIFADLGFTEVAIKQRPNDTYYIVSSYVDDDGTYSFSPRDLDNIKARLLSDNKVTEGSLLSSSDWMITRKAETKKAIPAAWSAYRAEVRRVADERETAIKGAADLADLESIMQSLPEWPASPDELIMKEADKAVT